MELPNFHNSGFLGSLPFLLGIIRSETGEIQWNVVLSSIMTALMIGLGVTVLEQEKSLAVIKSTLIIHTERLDRIENGQILATNDRYRRSDAEKDFAQLEVRLERRINKVEDYVEDFRKENSGFHREARK